MTREELFQIMPEGYEKACWETKAMIRKVGLQNEKDLLEPVHIGCVCGFSSIILSKARQKCAGILAYGKHF